MTMMVVPIRLAVNVSLICSITSLIKNVIKFKCGDIIYNNEYNHYGVVLSQSITPRGGDIVEYIWNRKDTGNFFAPIVSTSSVKHYHNSLPNDLKFLYDISDRLSHGEQQ